MSEHNHTLYLTLAEELSVRESNVLVSFWGIVASLLDLSNATYSNQGIVIEHRGTEKTLKCMKCMFVNRFWREIAFYESTKLYFASGKSPCNLDDFFGSMEHIKQKTVGIDILGSTEECVELC